jgi:hypothetical protein
VILIVKDLELFYHEHSMCTTDGGDKGKNVVNFIFLFLFLGSLDHL